MTIFDGDYLVAVRQESSAYVSQGSSVKSEINTERHRNPYKIWAKCIKKTQHLTTFTPIRFMELKLTCEVIG